MRFTPTPCIFQDVVDFILSLKGTCGQELVVLHTSPLIFGKFPVHARRVEWRFERRTSDLGSLRLKLVVASNQEVLNCVWPSVNQNWSLFFRLKHYLQTCTTMEIIRNQLPTKSPIEPFWFQHFTPTLAPVWCYVQAHKCVRTILSSLCTMLQNGIRE